MPSRKCPTGTSPSPLGRKDAGASFRLRLRGRRQCPGCRMGTSHVPFAMPAGRVVRPFAPDEGELLPPVTLPRSLRYRPHSASGAHAWRGHSIPHPSHRPRLTPPPPTCRNRPPLLPSQQRTLPVPMSITPGSMLSRPPIDHITSASPDPDYLSLPSRPPLPPREEGCRCVIPAASTWPPTMSRLSDGDKPRAVRNARWPRSAPVRSG